MKLTAILRFKRTTQPSQLAVGAAANQLTPHELITLYQRPSLQTHYHASDKQFGIKCKKFQNYRANFVLGEVSHFSKEG